ncbi:PAS domain-containing protein [Pseudomonas fakonensis]|uniref:histidine kinase n=1 Tax=Pseudomonas fakonensis TaxID=2842355 RepID=A0ABX8MZG1_9PSED|nr:PAS domain-containing protein [Pseudomonas fakonensis]QXH49524.1 PAS domain-containing protein [Pseudomonas fakonensis]
MPTPDSAAWPSPAAHTASSQLDWLCEHMAEGLCIVELIDGPHGPLSDYRYVYANAACTRHTGLRKVIGNTLRETVPGEADAWIGHYTSVLHSGEPKYIEQRLQMTGRNLALSIHRLEPASARRMAVLFHERTAAWESRADLLHLNQQLGQQVDEAQAQHKLFAQLVDSSLASVMVVDRDMRVLAINRTARQTFLALGLPEPLLGVSFRDYPPVFPQAKAQLLALWERALAGEVFVENVTLQIPPAERHYEMRFNLLRDAQGVMLGAYLFAYDISQRVAEQRRLRDTEQALRNAQKMEAVGQLTGGIAHDFNNLLGGISGALELAGMRLDQGRGEDARNLLGIAQQNTARAAQLVQRLLTFARHQTLQPRLIDLHTLLQGMQPLILTSLGEHITLVDLTQPGQWQACVDPSQLENALLNLCINARDAMPGGGTLTLACANLSLSQAQGEALQLPGGDYLQLKVLDNGSGMSESVSARAIDPFFTTKPLGQGTGLGLSMVYGFVRQSGGQLHIYSSPGQGTRVHLYLPRHIGSAEVPAAASLQPAPAPENLGACRVVLVEDDPILRVVIGEVMLDQGHQLEAFGTGIEALDALREGPAPALLITDIGLPGGLDGRKLALQALVLHPELRILFITGYDQAQALADFPLTDAMASIGKPFQLEAMLAVARGLLAP